MVDKVHGQNLAASLERSRQWLGQALGDFSFDNVPPNLRTVYASAAKALIFNTKAPQGKFGDHLANFPNRAVYCSSYLWDSCFHVVGLEHLNTKIAADGLRIMVENQQPDGEIPQFVCPTWVRPGGASQPPLIAWAAWRLYQRTKDRKLLDDIYGPVGKSVDWWLTKRDPDGNGLAEYSEPVASGWDDSPRFDEGKIEGVDLNAYLVREMRILSQIAQLQGKAAEAKRWHDRAEALAQRIVDRMYDRDANIFRDLRADTHAFVGLLTPASFMPLWVGVPLPEEKARAMIEKYLLNPDLFFGPYPFPVVAYNDPKYKPDQWWRGPIWPNIAWAMTEVLGQYGYQAQRRQAIERLVGMMAANTEIAELYNSQTGQPHDAPDHSWSCAAFIDWVQTLGRG
jgi:putative isomerase